MTVLCKAGQYCKISSYYKKYTVKKFEHLCVKRRSVIMNFIYDKLKAI